MEAKQFITFLIFLLKISISYGQQEQLLMPYVKGDLYGYANSKGLIIVPAKYSFAFPFENGFGTIVAKTRGTETMNRYGLVNHMGKVILEPTAIRIELFDSNGLAIIQGKNNNYGIININGEWIIPLKYAHIKLLPSCIIVQNSIGESSLLDLEGQTIIDFKFNQIFVDESVFENSNLVVVSKKNNHGLIQLEKDTYQMVIEPQYDYLSVFKNNLFIARKNGKYGLIDLENNTIIPFEHEGLRSKLNYLIAHRSIQYKPKIKTIKSEVPEIISRKSYRNLKKEYDDTSRIVYYLMSQELRDNAVRYRFNINTQKNEVNEYSVYNEKGQVVLKSQLGRFKVYESSLLGIKRDENLTLYNDKGEIILTNGLYELEGYNENLFVALSHRVTTNSEDTVNQKNSYKYGFMDTLGYMVIPLNFDEAKEFNLNLAPVKSQGKWALIDRSGSFKTKFIYDFIQYTGSNRYEFRIDSLWGFLDPNGVEVLSGTYLEIENSMYENHSYLGYHKFNFDNGLAKIFNTAKSQNKKCTLVDTNGIQLFPFIYNDIELIDNSLFKATLWIKELDRESVGLIDKNGKVIIPIYQREIKWLVYEKVFQVYTQDNVYVYYNLNGEKVNSPYEKIERTGFSDYRKLPNGFYAANFRNRRTVYFTPEGIPLFENLR